MAVAVLVVKEDSAWEETAEQQLNLFGEMEVHGDNHATTLIAIFPHLPFYSPLTNFNCSTLYLWSLWCSYFHACFLLGLS